MIRLCCTLLVLLASTAATAQPGPPGAFSFLRLEPTARAASMAGAFGATTASDPAVVFYNPAALSPETHQTLSLSYLNHLSDLSAGFVAYGHTLAGVDAAVGLRYFGWGEMTETDEFAQEMGTFGASNLALTLSGSRAQGQRLRIGASLHAVLATVAEYRASALAADFGVRYSLPEAGFDAGLSLHNAGVTLSSLGASRDVLPLDLRVGVSKRLQHLPLLVSATGYNLHDPGAGPADRSTFEQILGHLALGAELQFSQAFQLRTGFNPRRNHELRTNSRLDTAGLSLGFGIRVRRYHVDYAFASWSGSGGLHQFSLRTVL